MDDHYHILADRISRLESDYRKALDAVENKADDVAKVASATQSTLSSISSKVNHTDKVVNELANKISKWEGKFGGVLFIVTCLWAFFTGFPSALVEWVKNFGVK